MKTSVSSNPTSNSIPEIRIGIIGDKSDDRFWFMESLSKGKDYFLLKNKKETKENNFHFFEDVLLGLKAGKITDPGKYAHYNSIYERELIKNSEKLVFTHQIHPTNLEEQAFSLSSDFLDHVLILVFPGKSESKLDVSLLSMLKHFNVSFSLVIYSEGEVKKEVVEKIIKNGNMLLGKVFEGSLTIDDQTSGTNLADFNKDYFAKKVALITGQDRLSALLDNIPKKALPSIDNESEPVFKVLSYNHFPENKNYTMEGILLNGSIKKGEYLACGPVFFDVNQDIYTVGKIKDVSYFGIKKDKVVTGQTFSIESAYSVNDTYLPKQAIHRGLVLTSVDNLNHCKSIKLEVILTCHPDIFKPNLKLNFCCLGVAQTAVLTNIDDDFFLGDGFKGTFTFEFLFPVNIINTNSNFVLFDGKIRGYGSKITILK